MSDSLSPIRLSLAFDNAAPESTADLIGLGPARLGSGEGFFRSVGLFAPSEHATRDDGFRSFAIVSFGDHQRVQAVHVRRPTANLIVVLAWDDLDCEGDRQRDAFRLTLEVPEWAR
jgi:hypothetical protein